MLYPTMSSWKTKGHFNKEISNISLRGNKEKPPNLHKNVQELWGKLLHVFGVLLQAQKPQNNKTFEVHSKYITQNRLGTFCLLKQQKSLQKTTLLGDRVLKSAFH